MLRYSRQKLTAWGSMVCKHIVFDVSYRFCEKMKLIHGYFSLEYKRYCFYYNEWFVFFGLSVSAHYRIKYLLFKVKFRMYLCSLLSYYYKNFWLAVWMFFCVPFVFFKVYRYLTWCKNVFSFIFCYCCKTTKCKPSLARLSAR